LACSFSRTSGALDRYFRETTRSDPPVPFLTTLPPLLLGSPYPAFVPKTDTNGNDIAGIRLPEIAVPLATYQRRSWSAFLMALQQAAGLENA
jgi:Alpha/beta hydrolase domain